jgi:lipopolysaccharide/colanic/teichoic acid biosynthesis glycosyltransferase
LPYSNVLLSVQKTGESEVSSINQAVILSNQTPVGARDSGGIDREEFRGLDTDADANPVGNPGQRAGVKSRAATGEPGPFFRFAKRTIDIIGSSLLLALLSPVLLAAAILIRLDSGGPIFHRRRVLARQSYRESVAPHTFDAFKLRTMIPNADAVLLANPDLMREYQKDFKLRNDPRITRIGQPLRRISLDEVPQLLNVLRGQMSLVGPRMISPPELVMYGPRAGKLLSVKPGLTGLWQVSGRQTVGYTERVRLDMWYIDHRSAGLEMTILLRTIGSVLGRRGAF